MPASPPPDTPGRLVATLDVMVVSVIRSTLGPGVEVVASTVDPDDGRRKDDQSASWWTTPEHAPPVGRRLRAEIREAP